MIYVLTIDEYSKYNKANNQDWNLIAYTMECDYWIEYILKP